MIWRFSIAYWTLVYQNPTKVQPSLIASIRRQPEEQGRWVSYILRGNDYLRIHAFHAFGVTVTVGLRKADDLREQYNAVFLRAANADLAQRYERHRCAAIAANMQGKTADEIACAIMEPDQ